MECAHSILKGKNLTNVFWIEAINIIVYLKNRIPIKHLYHSTPFEGIYVYKPIVRHLRISRRKSFSHVPKEDRRKLDAKVIKHFFIVYCYDHQAYKMFDPTTHNFFAS